MRNATPPRRTFIILAAARDASLGHVGRLIDEECPWLDGTAEVSPSLLAETIASEASGLTVEQARRFLDCYNERVARLLNPLVAIQCEAYSAMVDALFPYGRSDACGDGDFWIVDDSLSSRSPCIQVFNGFRFPGEALKTLRSLLAAYAQAFDSIHITTSDGTEVAVIELDAPSIG